MVLAFVWFCFVDGVSPWVEPNKQQILNSYDVNNVVTTQLKPKLITFIQRFAYLDTKMLVHQHTVLDTPEPYPQEAYTDIVLQRFGKLLNMV